MNNEMEQYTVQDFLGLIDERFEKFVGKVKRIDVEWGTWSREMNLEIKKRMEGGDSDVFALGMVFSYWIVISQLLDLIFECKGLKRLLLENKIRSKTEEALSIRSKIEEV
ncbi:MAG: hypothetical protein ACW99G_20360 [Candidatus Thorarchaeota archaeon]|jgi:hypothetical protein